MIPITLLHTVTLASFGNRGITLDRPIPIAPEQPRSSTVALQSRTAAIAALGSLVLLAACSNSSAGPGLASCATPGTQLSLAVAAYASIDPASDSGCVTFTANASTTDSAEYLVVPQSATSSTTPASAPFLLRSATSVTAMVMPQVAFMGTGARRSSALAFDHFLREMGRTRDYPRVLGTPAGSAPIASATAAPPTVGSLRSFKVCADFTCSKFDNVGAKAQSVGQHIAIYVDTLAPSPGSSTSDLDSLKRVFDSRLYPLDTAVFGNISDIDSNTVVIVLMTNTVNKLVSKARCNAEGFIAGFFFSGDLAPGGVSSQFNNGEIFYSIVADPNGKLSCPHSVAGVRDGTGVTFTHEFQHMINFVEHVRVRGGNEEEGWLDEGLSKYAEEIAGRTYLPNDSLFSLYAINDAYDAYQYLSKTETSALLIPADTGTLAEVGASWLFTRYIVDQFGDSLPGRLVQTTLIGAANVAARTGARFDSTIARWGLTNWVSDLPNFTAPPELKYKIWHFRSTFGQLNRNDPRDFPLPYPLVPPISGGHAVSLSGKLWAGSGAYVRVMQPPNGAAFTLQFSANGSAPVSPAIVPRMTVIRIR